MLTAHQLEDEEKTQKEKNEDIDDVFHKVTEVIKNREERERGGELNINRYLPGKGSVTVHLI